MEPISYVIVNSEAICENKILWDGVTEWTPPPDTLVVPEYEVGMNIEIGQLVAQEIPPGIILDQMIADGYNPDARDGDGDGMVQDATQWERPIDTEV
jgi:hypothetical protein